MPIYLCLYELKLAKTKLWSLEHRRTRADLIEVYKKFTVYQLSGSAQLSHNERTRGHSLKLGLRKKRVMTDLGHFFSDRIVNKWKLELIK